MARRLPWKRSTEASSSNASNVNKDDNNDGKTVKASPSKRSPGLEHRLKKRYERLDSDLTRSPSTSPPPEAPEEKFMIPGPLDDDRYRMVEDEFLHMAQRFTAHLHHAEYDRLKTLAETQNAVAISEIERPVVPGLPTMAARRRHESVKRLAKQHRMLQDAGEDILSSSAAATPPLTSTGASLQGLMNSPNKGSRRLMPVLRSSSSSSSQTRAAAGFHSSSAITLTVPEPELPTLVSSQRTKLESAPKQKTASTSTLTETPIKGARATRTFQTPSRSSPKTPYPNSSAVKKVAFAGSSDSGTVQSNLSRNALSETAARGKRRASFLDDDDNDDDLFGLNERRWNRRKSREQMRKTEIQETPKKVDLDMIPSFL